MRIMHNIPSMNAYRNKAKNSGALAKNLERLSSGYRINRAGDDAAGLAISEKMRAQITGLDAAYKNVKDGISLIQTAEGAMQEIHDMLQRLGYLAAEAANGTYDDPIDRQVLQDEVNALLEEIDRIKETTDFNGIPLLLGEETIEKPPVATYKGNLPGWVLGAPNTTDPTQNKTLSTDPADMYTPQNATTTHVAAYVDFSQLNASNVNDLFGANVGVYTTCCTCDRHYSIRFADTTTHSMEESGRHYIYTIGIQGVQSGSDLIAKIREGLTVDENGTLNSFPDGKPQNHFTVFEEDPNNSGVLVMYDNRTSARPVPSSNRGLFGQGIAYKYTPVDVTGEDIILQIGDTADEADRLAVDLPEMTLGAIGIEDLSVETVDDALNAMARVRDGVNYVSAERGRMGAYQNRLEHTLQNLSVMKENITDAESRIRDVDMAEEMMAYTKNNILSQSAQAMLAQANALPQGVLQLMQ